MADIETLQIKVAVKIKKAKKKLNDLADELEQLAGKIEALDDRDFDVDAKLDESSFERDVSSVVAQTEALDGREATIHVNVDRDSMPALPAPDFGSNTRVFENKLDEMLESMGDVDLDFGEFNQPRQFSGRISELDNTLLEMAESDLDFGEFNQPRGFSGRVSDNQPSLLRRVTSSIGDITESTETFGKRLENANLRMSDLHNMMARLVPLLIVFIGAIPAVVGALATLAAAAVSAAAGLAAIAGFGALGLALEDGQFDMDNLTDAFETIKDSFIEAFAPLAEQLEPLFEEGIRGLERFFNAIASQSGSLMELTDEARAFGGFLIDFVPQLLNQMAALAEAFAPIFGDIGQFLEENLNNIVRTMVAVTQDAIPAISRLGFLIADFLPTLMKLSIGFVEVVNAVLMVIGGIGRLLSLLPIGAEQFGFLIAATLASASAFFLLGRSALTATYSALVKLIPRIYATAASFVGATASANAFTFSIIQLRNALLALASVTLVGGLLAGLGAVLGKLGIGFSNTTSEIQNATDSLKEFDRVSSRVSGDGDKFNPYGISATNQPTGTNVINVESSGNPREDESNIRMAQWHQGRTTGGQG